MSEKIRILVVDDHEGVRKSLVKLLALQEGMEVIGECSNGEEALIKAATLSPDIILMDVRMPMINGIDAAQMLVQKNLGCKVIIITMYEQYLIEAMKAGVHGYLLKGINMNNLTECIISVKQGKVFIDERICSHVGV